MAIKKSTYFPGIDALKGCLILQVVLTHALGDNNLRFLMYTYHMPLFMAVSGFLIKQERLRKLSFGALIKKYLYRLIIPWLVAFVFYNGIVYRSRILSFGMPELVERVIYAYYHLWFIPALLVMIICLWLIEKYRINPTVVLISSLIITTVWFAWFQWIDKHLMQQNLIYKFLGDKRNFIYFFFFYLSYLLKNYRRDLLGYFSFKRLIVTILVITPLLILSNYMKGDPVRPYYYTFFYLLFNVSIIFFVLSYLIGYTIKNSILQFSNNYSMVIYLYHYIILVTLHNMVARFIGESLVQTVLLFTGTCVILLPAIRILSKIYFIDLYIFGNTRRLDKKPVAGKDALQGLEIVNTESSHHVNI